MTAHPCNQHPHDPHSNRLLPLLLLLILIPTHTSSATEKTYVRR